MSTAQEKKGPICNLQQIAFPWQFLCTVKAIVLIFRHITQTAILIKYRAKRFTRNTFVIISLRFLAIKNGCYNFLFAYLSAMFRFLLHSSSFAPFSTEATGSLAFVHRVRWRVNGNKVFTWNFCDIPPNGYTNIQHDIFIKFVFWRLVSITCFCNGKTATFNFSKDESLKLREEQHYLPENRSSPAVDVTMTEHDNIITTIGAQKRDQGQRYRGQYQSHQPITTCDLQERGSGESSFLVLAKNLELFLIIVRYSNSEMWL